MFCSPDKGTLLKVRRWPICRRLESALRFPGKTFLALGERNGDFFRAGWQTVDLVGADHVCNIGRDPMPFADESSDALYASHVIEHLRPREGAFLLGEIRRVLKPGAVCRIVTPDLDLLIERYRAGDWAFFLRGDGRRILRGVCEGALSPELLLVHNRLVGWLASYSGRLDAAGGPIVEKELVDEKLASLSSVEFRDWCVSLLEPGRAYAHVCVYDFHTLRRALGNAGFTSIRRKEYGESDYDVLGRFDLDRARHREYSLYVEARKEQKA